MLLNLTKTSGNPTVDADGDDFVGAVMELFKGIWGQFGPDYWCASYGFWK